MKLTENEIKALKICLNYESIEAQLSDNFSNGGFQEFKDELGWNDKQVAALIKSLEAKDMGYLDDNDGNGSIFWLTTLGVETIFAIIDGEK